MKTITLDEQAYHRLRAWKRNGRESFSQVVKRIVPEPGTLGAFLNFVDSQRTDSLDGNDLMEETMETRSPEKADPWMP